MSTESVAVTGPASLRRAFALQLRVLHALLMRELITRFGRENLGVLWMAGEPMLFTLGVATRDAELRHINTDEYPVTAKATTGIDEAW